MTVETRQATRRLWRQRKVWRHVAIVVAVFFALTLVLSVNSVLWAIKRREDIQARCARAGAYAAVVQAVSPQGLDAGPNARDTRRTLSRYVNECDRAGR